MQTPSTPLNAELRRQLRRAIDQAVRARLEPAGDPGPECGTDWRDRSTPVHACTTCANRVWRRKQRSHR
jgi:hypothetical protein